MEPAMNKFAKGNQVRHSKYGIGIYLESIGYSDDLSVVRWDNDEQPKIVFTNELTKVEAPNELHSHLNHHWN